MSILDVIMRERRAAVQACRAEVPEDLLLEKAAQREHHSLKAKLGDGVGTQIIAEMKKASPSAGLMQEDYEPAMIADHYVSNGAAAISVLTEPLHFMGRGDDLRTVRSCVSLPILRKDFMCDPYQVVEAAAWGADVVLLIAAALRDDEMQRLNDKALELGMEVLAEVHTEEELVRVLPLKEAIIGVNSRNLKTLKTDLAVAHDVARFIPEDRLSVAESGIRERGEIEALEAAGYNGFLIGEALVTHDDPGGRLKELLGCK